MTRWQIALIPVVVVMAWALIAGPEWLATILGKALVIFGVSIAVLLGVMWLGLRGTRRTMHSLLPPGIIDKLTGWSFPSRLRAGIVIVQALTTTGIVVAMGGFWGYAVGVLLLAVFAAPKYFLSA